MKSIIMHSRISLILLIILCVVLLAVVSGCLIMNTKPFGQIPEGARLDSIKRSPNFRDGKFQNQTNRPDLSEGVSYWKAFWDSMTKKDKRSTPKDSIPTMKTDLRGLNPRENVLVWLGHSSSYLQLDGKRILIDPVLSKNGSPVSFINKAYKGTSIYQPADFPDIDVLLISHDHWDHLDYPTVKALQPRVKKVICGLGTGEHFRRWGYREDQIVEKDWNQLVVIDSSLKITVTPAHHNSGRGTKIRRSLWASFVIRSTSFNIYYSGDSGYDKHFKAIGQAYGPFDLSLIECGQYDQNYKYTHMQPEQSMQAAIDLKTVRMVPVHWAKFTESNHAWDEPIKRITALARQHHLLLVTPMIGQAVDLDHIPLSFPEWWRGIN
ncbi:MBL fold metallo-hydrolase [Pedobacter sp. L105]|uniref:MBL fold metallo-hydrolase n=1 Tax=Pedobacter sp. L105 TaxID=1641871 RepID=UPI001C209555|nr:MBL fold metallo-hydrolase [Pedobacter sp. L105]